MNGAHFKAYDHRGQLVLAVSTRGESATAIERMAFIARLNRYELGRVDVAYDDSHRENERLHGGARNA